LAVPEVTDTLYGGPTGTVLVLVESEKGAAPVVAVARNVKEVVPAPIVTVKVAPLWLGTEMDCAELTVAEPPAIARTVTEPVKFALGVTLTA
jgi:predicted transcriptional regulator